MSCSRSIVVHLTRGLGAVVLLVLAFSHGSEHPVLLPLLLIGAVALLGGCPMCWLMGLVEAAKARRDPPHAQ
ncbi:MAG TPA: hypothetical protein VII39_11110 [Bradyrhizobium sp.]